MVHLMDGSTQKVNFPPLSVVWATGHPKDFFAVEPSSTDFFFDFCFTYVDENKVSFLQVDIGIRGDNDDDDDDQNTTNNAFFNDLKDVSGVRIYLENPSVTGVKTRVDTTSSVGEVQRRLPTPVDVTSARIFRP
jgi:hypothetical protein